MNTDSVWHSKGHIAKPGVAGESDLLQLRAIVSVNNQAVANHCAAKKFAGGILLHCGKLLQPGGLRDPC